MVDGQYLTFTAQNVVGAPAGTPTTGGEQRENQFNISLIID
jgi:hypothetical protein